MLEDLHVFLCNFNEPPPPPVIIDGFSTSLPLFLYSFISLCSRTTNASRQDGDNSNDRDMAWGPFTSIFFCCNMHQSICSFFRCWIRICRIRMFMSLLDPDLDPLSDMRILIRLRILLSCSVTSL
jgi:hypothetical protein